MEARTTSHEPPPSPTDGHGNHAPRSLAAVTVIDHLSFPHIIDAIYASAPRAALVSLRAASRAHKARADALLAKHVVMNVSYASERRLVSLSGPRGSRIPSLRQYATPIPFWDLAQRLLPTVLGATRILDLNDGGPDPDVYESLRAIPHLTTLRCNGTLDESYILQTRRMLFPPSISAPAPHFIAFISKQRTVYEADVVHNRVVDIRYYAFLPTVPDETRRAVLHFQLDVNDPDVWFVTVLRDNDTLPDTLEEMTIIFTHVNRNPLSSNLPKDQVLCANEYDDTRWVMFRALLGRHVRRVRFTIVGLKCMHQSNRYDVAWDGVTARGLQELMVAGVLGIPGHRRRHGTTRDVVEKNIKCLTHEEYRQRTEQSQWELEMVR